MCGGDFMNKNPNEAFQFLDCVVEVSRSWEEPIFKEPPRDRTMNRERASGVYTLPEGLDVQAKFATVMRRVDDLEAKGIQELSYSEMGKNMKGLSYLDTKWGNKTLEILEVLKQVKINIPLLDMIKQLPAYAKFLKDLCTVKRMIKLSKKAFLT
ncbi:hypothetical protein CK203_060328 [Vitis vinifera]|uniref:Uncharacterized protein n=1 Tax=Vitis vinifera TaxID=29760 RepID=A0A438FRZ4_VITVI|nr:hypothetical protein CK203_060328 [Vitis vinifera]